MTLLQRLMFRYSCERFLIQLFKLYLTFLSFLANTRVECLSPLTGLAHPCSTAPKKLGCWGQKFANLKMLALGIVVPITILQGIWPEVILVLTVNSCIKVRLDLQADKSPVVVKGPFFPRVVNPRYRIRGTMCNARIQSSKARKAIL
jgi:hypothetical protein